MRLRANVDGNQAQLVSAMRQLGVRVLHLHQLGGGVPDLLCYRAGYPLRLLEVKDGRKSPSRRRLTELEKEFAKEWPVNVVGTLDEAMDAVYGRLLTPREWMDAAFRVKP